MNAYANGEKRYPNENTANYGKESLAKSNLLNEGLYSVVSSPILETKPSPILETLTTPIMSGYESLVFEHSHKTELEKGYETVAKAAPAEDMSVSPKAKTKKKEPPQKKKTPPKSASNPPKQQQNKTQKPKENIDTKMPNPMMEAARKAEQEQTLRIKWKETAWDIKKNVEDTFQNKTLREQLNTKVCPHCGAKIAKNRKYCNICGKPADGKGLPPSPVEYHDTDPKKSLKADGTESKLLAILSYLGILVLIPLFSPKHSNFSHFHMKQGTVLMVAFIVARVLNWISTMRFQATGVMMVILSGITFLSMMIIFFIYIMRIRGIIHVIQGKEEEVPIIGKYAL